MPNEVVATKVVEIAPVDRSFVVLVILIGTEFTALLGLLVWMR